MKAVVAAVAEAAAAAGLTVASDTGKVSVRTVAAVHRVVVDIVGEQAVLMVQVAVKAVGGKGFARLGSRSDCAQPVEMSDPTLEYAALVAAVRVH